LFSTYLNIEIISTHDHHTPGGEDSKACTGAKGQANSRGWVADQNHQKFQNQGADFDPFEY